MALDFRVKFDLTSEPKIVLTDATTEREKLGGAWIRVLYPDGVVTQYGDANNPVLNNLGDIFEIEPRLAINQEIQIGNYTFFYYDLDYNRTEKSATIVFGDITYDVEHAINPFTPRAIVSDRTNYSLFADFAVSTVQRAWAIKIVDNGNQFFTDSSVAIDLSTYGAGPFDSRYDVRLISTVAYTSLTGTWLSVEKAYLYTSVIELRSPPIYSKLVAAVAVIKDTMDAVGKNTDEYERYFIDFRRCITLLSHLDNIFLTDNDTSKAQTIVKDIMDIVYSNLYTHSFSGQKIETWDITEQFSIAWTHIRNKPELFDTAWSLIQNKPQVFPPEYHKHSPADIETFVYIQAEPSREWVIQHNLAKFPSLVLVDDQNNLIFGDFRYEGPTTITVMFNTPLVGYAYLN